MIETTAIVVSVLIVAGAIAYPFIPILRIEENPKTEKIFILLLAFLFLFLTETFSWFLNRKTDIWISFSNPVEIAKSFCFVMAVAFVSKFLKKLQLPRVQYWLVFIAFAAIWTVAHVFLMAWRDAIGSANF